MSQITRCPSCGTTFKVVADQLRISEGWVRCGQCKEVFDAAAHLLVAETGHLLPEMSFESTGSRWTPPAKDAPEPARVWGSARQAAARPSPPPSAATPAPAPSQAKEPLRGEATLPPLARGEATLPPLARGEATLSSLAEMPAVPATRPSSPVAPAIAGDVLRPADELRVPARAIPSFLSPAVSDERDAPVPDWSLEPASPYGWRTRERVVTPQPVASGVPGGAVASGHEPPEDATTPESPLPTVSRASEHARDAEPLAKDLLDSGLDGYELPMPQLRDSEWPESEGMDQGDAGEFGRALPSLDATPALPGQPAKAGLGKGLLVAASAEAAEEPSKPFDPDERADSGRRKSKSHSMRSAKQSAREVRPSVDDDEFADASPEPGFVRSARRRAFWSRPAVRAAMGCFAMALGLALFAQMALRERDHWAARYPALQPLLTAMCAPWNCTTSAPRQIADVVIDSSSFIKSRADTYQLAVTIKSRADVPLAMPAMELTLTDAQDQPVMRKVLHASDIAAPSALAPQGDWSGTLSISLASGGSRVAGYRLLAFYP